MRRTADRGAARRRPEPSAPPRATLLDRFFAYRPLLCIPAIALFEAGRVGAGGGAWPSWRALPALGSLLAILGAVHVANGWRDRSGDRRNRKGGAIASGVLSARDVTLLGVFALFLAIVVAGAPTVGNAALALLAAAALLGAAYTLPPFEWKRRPGLDLLAQAAGYGVVAFCLGAVASDRRAAITPSLLLATLPYAFGIAAVGLVTMLADRTGDEATGQRTTAVVAGSRRAAEVAVWLALFSSASGFVQKAWVPALWGLLAAGLLVLPPLWRGRGEGAPSGSDADSIRGDWNRVALALQLLFLVLLATRSLMAITAAAGLAFAATAYDRSRGGGGYPLFGGRASGPSPGDL